MTTQHAPTPAQRRVLSALRFGLSLDHGRAELSLETGLYGAALEATIDACKRRGWIDADGFAKVAA
jgi:hypothetical protein